MNDKYPSWDYVEFVYKAIKHKDLVQDRKIAIHSFLQEAYKKGLKEGAKTDEK